MRPIDHIYVHCTATVEGKHYTVDDIRGWHVTGNGWSDIGYHKVIYLDGSVHDGRPESQVGAHVADHNTGSLGLVYVGGVDSSGRAKDTRTTDQRASLLAQVKAWQAQYNVPTENVLGHYEVANKACPSFDMDTFRAELAGDVQVIPPAGASVYEALPTIGGNNSKGEIQQLQRIIGVNPDGFIGADTYRALDKYLSK